LGKLSFPHSSIIVVTSVPVRSVMVKLPFTCIGCVNFTFIVLLNPFASHLKPDALKILTGEVPLIITTHSFSKN
jgi:hypothetical protein